MLAIAKRVEPPPEDGDCGPHEIELFFDIERPRLADVPVSDPEPEIMEVKEIEGQVERADLRERPERAERADDREIDVERRKNPLSSAYVEATQIDASAHGSFAKEQHRDEEAAEHEEHVDAQRPDGGTEFR